MARALRASDNAARNRQGVTATLREQKTRQLATLVRSGFALEAVTEVAEACDSLDGDWRVLCLSTPRTILRDLQAKRSSANYNGVAHTTLPELSMLQKIGRGDLVDPSLL